MKTLATTVLILALLINVNAQYYFPKDTAQWDVVKVTNYPPLTYQFLHYKMKGDTFINGLQYSKIYLSNVYNYYSTEGHLHCFLREDSTQKVFVKYPLSEGVDTNEFIIYDFNLAIGDTFPVRLLHYYNDSVYYFKVVDVGNDNGRKGFSLLPSNNLPYPGYIWMYQGDGIGWVEGIGSNNGLFYSEIPEFSGDSLTFVLQCVKHNGVFIYGGGTVCGQVNINKIKLELENITIYPNPLNSTSIIKINKLENFHAIEIYNSLGKLLKIIEVNNKDEIQLNFAEFLSGFYLCKAIKKNNTFVVLPFSIQ